MIFEDFEDLDFGNKDDSVPSVVVPIPKVLTEDAVGEELIDLSLLRTPFRFLKLTTALFVLM